MLTPADILRIPYTSDLSEGSVAHALRSLPHIYERAGGSLYDRLRRTVAHTAVELAFRRHLSAQGIPFEVKSATPFTDSDRYDVLLDGRRCDVKSFFISHRGQVSEMRRNPSVLLKAPALVPSDANAADGHMENDIYLFAFLAGLTAVSQTDLQKAVRAGQPHALVHIMGGEWRRPYSWNPLGPLTLKSESEEELLVELSGQDEGRGGLKRIVSLPPKTKVTVDDPFYSLAAVHVRRKPHARIGIHSPAQRETHIISPMDWVNIWVYGLEIFFAGYMLRGEFNRLAKDIHPGARVFQYTATHTKNRAVPISALRPLSQLFG